VQSSETSEKTKERPVPGTLDLAIERTLLALDRTHLAWIRTVLAMIASGYAIDRVVEIMHAERLSTGKAWTQEAHITGIILVGLATVAIALETYFYVRRRIELLESHSTLKFRIPSSALISLAIFIVGCVVLLFVSER